MCPLIFKMRRLYRPRKNRIVAGVLSGFGEYLNVDPVLVRIIFVLLLIFTGFFPAVIAYIIAWLIMPEK